MKPASLDPPLLWGDLVPETYELEYPNGSLIGIGGPVGAGKSTLTKRLEGEAVSFDEYRAKVQAEQGLNPQAYHPECWGQAFERVESRIRKCLAVGETVLVDATLLTPGSLYTMSGFAKEAQSEFHAIYLNATLEECLGAMDSRPAPIPDEQVISYYGLMETLLIRLVKDPYFLVKQGVASAAVLNRKQVGGLSGLKLT